MNSYGTGDAPNNVNPEDIIYRCTTTATEDEKMYQDIPDEYLVASEPRANSEIIVFGKHKGRWYISQGNRGIINILLAKLEVAESTIDYAIGYLDGAQEDYRKSPMNPALLRKDIEDMGFSELTELFEKTKTSSVRARSMRHRIEMDLSDFMDMEAKANAK